MLLDGCGSNFITLPYAFVCFDWFILHWWKWINIQSQQRCFYLWQMEFGSVCCFKNLLLRNCHFFIGHYKAVFTHSRKQINCVFPLKVWTKKSKIRVDYNFQPCRSILENCLSLIYFPIKKNSYFQLQVSASYFGRCFEKTIFFTYMQISQLLLNMTKTEWWKICPKYENCGHITMPHLKSLWASSECLWCLSSFPLIYAYSIFQWPHPVPH